MQHRTFLVIFLNVQSNITALMQSDGGEDVEVHTARWPLSGTGGRLLDRQLLLFAGV